MGNQASSSAKVQQPDEMVENERGLNVENVVDSKRVSEQEEEEEYYSSDSDTDSETDDEEEEEDDEEFLERLRILEDAKQLKKLAVMFAHPELPVESEPTACARCYFDRPSAPEQETVEEAEERAQILADAAALKQVAIDYLHPELPVVTNDSTACARCYFDRASAPEQESFEEAEERAHILEDAAALKKLATDFAHPEVGIPAAQLALVAAAATRCFFERASAPDQESLEEAEEQARILEEAKQLKQLAVDYMHPELPVVSNDPTACARCYFDRYSAPEQESMEEAEERAMALADAAALKQAAIEYLHPELPVVSNDSTACARCYFDRPSAPEQESTEEAEERARILADAAALKKLAVDYMHPELPVTTSDPTVFGRNYFNRASAPEQESLEEAEERARILADAKQLKELAIDYMHPELPVVNKVSLESGEFYTIGSTEPRCFFDRPSAPEQESFEEAEERARVLADAAALKKLAVDYMHPELPVTTTDATAFGRNYFTRPSAPEQETVEDAEERAMALADAAALKQLAVDYMHPELPVVSNDAIACARSYFDRASAVEQESVEEAEERARILADAAALKQLAVDYMHTELPVVTSDPTACARCYFDRPSAPVQSATTSTKKEEKPKQGSSVRASSFKHQPAIKTVETHLGKTTGVRKSASAVQLYGLDGEENDAGLF
ncbi:hypothetical protein CTEN210_11634 [Chaetoceros tenuissimus]|uniref:Uncharacterized protein n=1 Tax=Chaetoceros tenuissimus TaxID=426638 RepID=A0AAD3H9Q4_9STRA|nr:hypothetical protein CTEN210_11634 [Chaetoceros tenuissimus]